MLSVRSVYGLIDDNKKDNTFEVKCNKFRFLDLIL